MAGLNKSIALITVEEFKNLAVIDASDNTPDAQIELFINYASALIEKLTKRKFITPSSAIDEYFDGDNSPIHYLKQWPIVSDISYIYYLDNNAWSSALSGVTFSQFNDDGYIQFTDGHEFMETGIPNYYKISYTYGYLVANVPADLKLACAHIAEVRRGQFSNKSHGIATKAHGNFSTTYKDIDQWAIDTIGEYTRHH